MMWVFAYGSLMWRPAFPYARQHPARLPGYRRAFCRLSFRHRGTPESPGMVLGLSPGAGCHGVAYGVGPRHRAAVLAYLDEREGPGYRRVCLPIELKNGAGMETGKAWAYLPEPSHPTHAPNLPEERMVELVATGVGKSGTARDYLRELMTQLDRLGVEEPGLREMLAKVERYAGAGNPAADRDTPGRMR